MLVAVRRKPQVRFKALNNGDSQGLMANLGGLEITSSSMESSRGTF